MWTPQCACDVAGMINGPPQWQTIFTVPNLDSFTNFIVYYATDAEVAELTVPPVVYHQLKWDFMATRIPVGVMVGE